MRHLLVTGSNRSGTTWVGQMLAHSGALRQRYEPFNPGLWPRWFSHPLPYRNLYVCAENEAAYVDDVERILAGRRPLLSQAGDARSLRDAARLCRDALRSVSERTSRRRVLLKDPIALFSAPWLAERFDLDVVVMIRNPAAFTSSIIRLGWAFDFRNWLNQDLLMRDLLTPLEREIAAMVDRPGDLLEQAILLWRGHYLAVDRFRSRFPRWHFVRWEDLAEDPGSGFEQLYRDLYLDHTPRAAARIAGDTAPGNITEVAADDTGPVRRDSRATARAWRHRLSGDDIARVRDGVGDLAERFYGPEEWAIEVAP